MKVDRVVMGSDSGPLYRTFWPMVATAWRNMGIEPVLGYVGDVPEGWETYGTVVHFPPRKDIPDCNMAKISRMFMAMDMRENCVIFSDLDMLPLRADYFLNAADGLEENKLRNLSADACTNFDIHRYPICYWVGRGDTFAKLFNPNNLSNIDLLNSWIGQNSRYDHREDPSKLPFSDESMIKKLLLSWDGYPQNIEKRARGWTHPKGSAGLAHNRIDRADWRVDIDRLNGGEYIDSHLLRPLQENKRLIKPLAEYLGLVEVMEKS